MFLRVDLRKRLQTHGFLIQSVEPLWLQQRFFPYLGYLAACFLVTSGINILIYEGGWVVKLNSASIATIHNI